MKKIHLYGLLSLLAFVYSLGVQSQIVSGNVFLQGQYIRLGLSPQAAFGSTVDAPAGMLPAGADAQNNPACNKGKLGFISDLGRDGWTTGSPAFIGDYFVPGTPEEGWAIHMDGADFNNNRWNGFIVPATGDGCVGGAQMSGSWIDFQDLPDRQVAVWQGTINNLKIIKKITLPKDKMYFITEVKLVNTGAVPITDVYYMRNVDPDNEVSQVGSSAFTTNNKIEYQNPVSGNKALVSARGNAFNSYLGLGTIDCRARVCIRAAAATGLANRSPVDVWNATAPRLGNLNDQVTQDAPIAISFKVGAIAPLDTARLAFAYILSIADLEEALSKTAPQFNVDGQSVLSGGGAINCTGAPIPITITNGEDYNWVWSPATGLNTTIGPSVIYTPQPVPITYTITGSNVICNNATLTITIYPATSRLADYVEDAPCGSKTVNFTNQSLTMGDPTTVYQWDFGDGSPISSAISPTHTYANFGSWDVKLIVITSRPHCGNDTIYTKTVQVRDKPVPVVDFTNTACENADVTFTGSAAIANGSIASQQWTFPGGITYNTPVVTHAFNPAGVFNVKYKVVSDRGCADSVVKIISVESYPTVSFDASNGCMNKIIPFTNNSSNVVGAITGYTWDFGNGSGSTQQNPSSVYSTYGNKTIKLTATTINGCSNSFTKTIDIEATPLANFTYTNACINAPVNFFSQVSTDYGTISDLNWVLAPSVTSTLPNPTYTFTREGDYVVSLKAVSSGGCESAVKTATIQIRKVKADAGKDTLVFKNTPFQLRGDGGLMYTWTPSTFLNSGTIRNPIGSIDQDQVFRVDVIDERGCKGSDLVNITVFVDDDIYVPTGFTPNNDGKNDMFRPTAPPGVVYLFEVYNRWGQRVFISNNPEKGWDGRLGNVAQPAGVYVWYLKAKTRAGKLVEKKGTMTLLR